MDQRLAKLNYEYCREVVELKKDIERNYLELAGRLCKIEDEKMYEPNYETFADFLEEIHITPSVASRMKTIWRKFVLEYDIKPVKIAEAGGWDKVYSIVKISGSKQQAEDWLHKINHLNRADLRKEIKELETGVTMSECKHIHTEAITFHKCLDCGDTWREYGDK